jgi:hypothetical protein
MDYINVIKPSRFAAKSFHVLTFDGRMHAQDGFHLPKDLQLLLFITEEEYKHLAMLKSHFVDYRNNSIHFTQYIQWHSRNITLTSCF